ncbi:MAG TPA: MFS transporter, partial [Allocoleopsis sp.]
MEPLYNDVTQVYKLYRDNLLLFPTNTSYLIAMKIFFTLDKPTRNNFLILFVFGLLFWASVASMLPTLPPYIKSVGGTDQQIGLVMGSFAIGLLICRSWLGKIADEKSRKEVILIGTIVAAIAPIGFAIFSAIPILFALRAFHGISVAAFTTGYSALIVDLAPLAIRGEIIGYMSLVTPIGIAIGPALGGLLEAKIGYVALFLFASLLGLISTIGLTQIKEKRAISVQDNLSDDQTEDNYVIKIFTNHALVIPTVVLLMIGFGMGGLITFIPLYIKQTNIDFSAGLFYSMAALASFTSRLFTGKGSDRFGRGI